MRSETFSSGTVIAFAPREDRRSAAEDHARLRYRQQAHRLPQAGCRSSYSHGGQYNTLDELASYDQDGLWSYGNTRFSAAGTLLATAETLVERSPAGLFARELAQLVQVDGRNALRKLVRHGPLERRKLDRRFLYCRPSRRRQQVRARRVLLAGEARVPLPVSRGVQIRVATATLLSVFDERQRRLFAGLESLSHGHGGGIRVAARLGMAPATVAKGRKELLSADFETDRVRKPGGRRAKEGNSPS